ncbi:hypothetical protein, partial [Mycobacterium sp. E136]|uniref:hypothetical protein n=1 Tax=Mycobacterium sp. E136 TaxID=1834125 RepID=UPI0018D43259
TAEPEKKSDPDDTDPSLQSKPGGTSNSSTEQQGATTNTVATNTATTKGTTERSITDPGDIPEEGTTYVAFADARSLASGATTNVSPLKQCNSSYGGTQQNTQMSHPQQLSVQSSP